MAKLFGIEKAARDLADLHEAKLLSWFEAIGKNAGPGRLFESPLEALFNCTFWSFFRGFCEEFDIRYETGAMMPDLTLLGEYDLYSSTQAKIEDYRVDFLFAVRTQSGAVRYLVVECDGHEFHERTKEQAAKDRSRDRRLQALSFTVMRFTGSELYRDPIKCVTEVMEWAASHMRSEK